MGGPALINEKYYNEFDNFYICSFVEDDIIYKSTEHYYQSKKFIDEKVKKLIIDAKNAHDAWSLGQMYPLKKGWDNIKVKIMLDANKLKFDQNPHLKELLIQTEHDIEFPYSDNFWRTMLGKILMIIRAYYKNENRRFFTLQDIFNFHIDWN
jgi:ribA/ribD-fused uncharacterized protein